MSEYEPEYNEELDEEEICLWMEEALADSKTWFDPIHKEAVPLYELYAGKSLSDTDARYLNTTRGVAVDFAFATGIINTVIGSELAARMEAVWNPQDKTARDAAIAEWLTQVVRVTHQRASAHRLDTDAYLDGLITGYGYCRRFLDLSRMPIRPRPGHIQPWKVYPDPDAQQDNLEDATYIIVESNMLLEEAQARWPEKREALRAATMMGTNTTSSNPTPTPTITSTGVKLSPSRRKRVTIYEFQYRCTKERVVYTDPETGERKDTVASEFRELKSSLEAEQKAVMDEYAAAMKGYQEEAGIAAQIGGLPPMPPEVPELPVLDFGDPYFYPGFQHYVAHIARGGDGKPLLLLDRTAISVNEFTIKAYTGLKWKHPTQDRVRFYGLARVVYDAVVWLNRALRDYLDIMARSPKGGGFIGEGAFGGDPQKIANFRRNAAVPGYWHTVADSALQDGLILQNQPVAPPDGFRQIYEMCIAALGRLTGVTEWLQGTGSSDRSNAYVTTMQEQGLQMLLPIREPRTALTVSLGKLTAALLLEHLPAEELDRILGEQKPVAGVTHERNPETGEMDPIATPGQILKEAEILAYDVTTDVGAATPFQKMATWLSLSQHGLADTFREWGVPAKIMVPTMMRNSPIPGTEAERMASDLEEFYEQEEKMRTEQGALEFFQGLDPQAQMGFLEQIHQMIQPPPGIEGAMPPQEM